MQVMVLKRIMQIKTLNKILALIIIRYIVEASDWYAVMNLFVVQIFSSLVVVAECKQKSKDGCSVNHRLIKNNGRYFESRHKSHVNTNYYDELDTSGNVRSGSSTVKFPIPFNYTQQTYMYNAVIKSRSMKWKV